MKTKTPKFAAVLMAGVAMMGYAVVTNAQPPRGRGASDGTAPRADAAIAYLALTETQLASFKAIRDNAHTAAEPILEQVRTKMQALREARQNSDATKMASIQLEIDALQAQVKKIRDDAQVQIVGSLNPDQKAKLANLQAAADLMDEVRQAAGLGLLTPPDGAGRGGAGFGRGKGKGGPKGGPAGF